jgi:hypothetical protein
VSDKICPLDVQSGHLYLDRNTGKSFLVYTVEIQGVVVYIEDVYGQRFTYGGLYPYLVEIPREPVTLDETWEEYEMRTNPYGMSREEMQDER